MSAVAKLFVFVIVLSVIATQQTLAFSPAWRQYMKAAVMATERRDFLSAESSLRSALEEAGKAKNKLWTVVTLNQFGLLYQEQDEYEKAEAYFKQALVLSEKALGPHHEQVADCLMHCSDLAKDKGQRGQANAFATKAEICLRRCAAIEREKGHSDEASRLELRADRIKGVK